MASLASTSSPKLADIPETEPEDDTQAQQSISEEEREARRKDEEKFYDRLVGLTRNKGESDGKDLDNSDFQFLTDFAICNITLTVYRELQNNTFFNQSQDPEDPEVPEDQADKEAREGGSEEDEGHQAELETLQNFPTRGLFRLCQLYPLVLRATIGYYSSIAINYYEDTIEQRRYDQVPIGLNAKAYAIVCGSVRKLVEKEMELREQERG